MLEQERVAAFAWIKDADADEALQQDQHKRDGQHRRAEHHQQRGGVVGPAEQRHAKPGHARSAHPVDGDDEVQAGKD